MSTVNSQGQNQDQTHECQDGVCTSNFKPVRTGKPTFENIKIIAGGLIDKVKETLTGEHDIVDGPAEAQAGEISRLSRMQQTMSEKPTAEQHLSIASAEIIDRFCQNNWNPQSGSYQPMAVDTLHAMQVRIRPAAGSQMKAGRYDNPWRYDNRH